MLLKLCFFYTKILAVEWKTYKLQPEELETVENL